MEKTVLPKEKRFIAAFNANGTPLYVHALDPMQQGERAQYLRTIETSFLREDVASIEVWSVQGPNGRIFQGETFTWNHPDLHFAQCEWCDSHVLLTQRYAKCENCHRIRCTKHGKYHHKSNKSFCLDCYQAEEQA